MTRFQKACSDVKNKRLDDTPQPPEPGGEPASLIDQLDDYLARINGDDRGSDGTVNELRTHFVRLQAEVERLKVWQENYESLEKVLRSERQIWNRESSANAKQSGKLFSELGAIKARTAELEGLLREAFSELTEMKNSVGYRGLTLQVMGRIDAALAEGAKS